MVTKENSVSDNCTAFCAGAQVKQAISVFTTQWGGWSRVCSFVKPLWGLSESAGVTKVSCHTLQPF